MIKDILVVVSFFMLVMLLGVGGVFGALYLCHIWGASPLIEIMLSSFSLVMSIMIVTSLYFNRRWL